MDGKWLGFPAPAQHQSLLLVCNPLCSANELQCNYFSQLHWYQLGLHSTTASLWPIMWIGVRLSSFCAIQQYHTEHCMSLHWKVLDCIWLQGVALSWHLAHWTWFLGLLLTNISFFVWQTCISLVYISPESIDQHSRQFRKINRFCSESVPCQGSALKLKLFSE